MRAPIDVLEVLDAEISNEHVPGFVAARLQQAREEIAELIEAASDGLPVAGYSEHGNAMVFTMERVSRLRAALVRVKGGAA